jgi:hypothetical protein
MEALAAMAAAELVVDMGLITQLLVQQTKAAAAVVLALMWAAVVALVLLLFLMLAHNVVQAVQLLQLVAIPFTLLHQAVHLQLN